MDTCPVCGMEIDEEDAVDQAIYQGETYYFCSDQCANMFEANPEQFVVRETAVRA